MIAKAAVGFAAFSTLALSSAPARAQAQPPDPAPGAPPSSASSSEAPKLDYRLRTEVISRADTRRQGWYVFGIVGGVGAASTTTALIITCGENRECAKWTSIAFWGGLGALSVGALIGLPMIGTKDEVSVTVTPVAPAPVSLGRFPAYADERGFAVVRGLTITASL